MADPADFAFHPPASEEPNAYQAFSRAMPDANTKIRDIPTRLQAGEIAADRIVRDNPLGNGKTIYPLDQPEGYPEPSLNAGPRAAPTRDRAR